MIRMRNSNSSCDCGRATKERGSFVTKSKVYETRSGAQRPQEVSFSGENDDIKLNSPKEENELHIKMVESTLIQVPPLNKSSHFKRSSVNLSKTSINKLCDNKVVANGNARSLAGNVLDGTNVINPNDASMDSLECKCVRSNMNFEEINDVGDELFPLTENKDGSEMMALDGEQNGVCEICDCNGENESRCSCPQNANNFSGNLNVSLEESSGNAVVNGYLNGNDEHLFEHNEKIGFNLIKDENGQSCRDEVENLDENMLSDRRDKKRKSNFEKIFDSYAELGCYSDKRRSRRPPESYSPEPSRRIKLENLFGESGNLPVTAKVKKKAVRKPRQKGPIFHYLDLYIRNKDIKGQSPKQEIPDELLIHPSLIKQEEEFMGTEEPQGEVISPILLPQSPSCSVPLSEGIDQAEIIETSVLHVDSPKCVQSDVSLKNDIPGVVCQVQEKVYETACNPEIPEVLSPKSIPCPRVSSLPKTSDEVFSDNCTVSDHSNKKTKVVSNKHKKGKNEKPKELTYDADVSRILGYRHNKGKNEFLVLFHNGTSNWVIQENNITIIPSYKEYFEHSEHELSTINRLAYFIMINSMMDRENECCSETEENIHTTLSCKEHDNTNTIPSTPLEVSQLHNLNGSSKDSKECTIFTSNGPLVSSIESLAKKGKESTVINDESSLCSDSDIHIDTSPLNCISNVNYIQNAFCARYKETISKSDLNELCNYVMSSRHIKLYPFETNKEVVFKRDEEFMHIYLKNIRKNHDDLRRLDDHLDVRSCEKLIYTLEDCAVDNSCEVVVISGIEEYFALKNIFDKLLKKPAIVEGRNYEQDVSMLRYLIQTIRNFTKPICAVIKKTATGLPASMLSLFDMVFDERGENFVKKTTIPKTNQKKPKEKPSKKKKIDKKIDHTSSTDRVKEVTVTENFQSYLFPRLMGLTESNESQIMGEGQKTTDLNDHVACNYYNKRMLSVQLRKSLRNMKSNTKIQLKNRGRNQSLNSEEELEEIVAEQGNVGISAQPSLVIQENIDNLEKEIEREKELTKRSMDELESILHSMEPC